VSHEHLSEKNKTALKAALSFLSKLSVLQITIKAAS